MNADELRDALEALGLSQREAARRLGVHHMTVWYWLQGQHDVPGPAQAAIECWLSRPPDHVDDGHGDPG